MSAEEESSSPTDKRAAAAGGVDPLLEQRLATLTARIYRLETEVAELRGAPPPAFSPGPATAAAPPPTLEQVPRPAAEPTREYTPVRPLPVRDAESLESRVGSQWFNRIGILAVLIGVALFLKLAFDNHWIGPLGRVLIGLAGGAALVLWSERFRSRGYAAFSYALKGLGTGVLYLSLWTASSVYGLVPSGVAFAGMVLVTVTNAWTAWRQRAELLAVYAIVGAFATPLLLSTGENQETFLFSYLLLMNVATLALLVLRGWDRLLLLAFLGTAAFFAGWYSRFYTQASFGETAFFLGLFFVLFAVAAVWAGDARSATRPELRVIVSALNAAFGFLGFFAMVSQQNGARSPATAVCAAALGAVYLGLFAAMRSGEPKAGWSLLRETQLALGIVLFATAVPLAVHGSWVTVEWMAGVAVLVWLASRHRSALLAALAAGLLVLALISLAVDATETQRVVIWNARMLSFVASAAALSVAAWFARRAASHEWRQAAAALGVLTHALVVIAVLLEIGTYWSTQPIAATFGTADYRAALADRRMAERFNDSAWLLIASAVVLAWGFRRRSAPLRWEGLALLAITIVKVFLIDTSTLSHGYRSLSFLVLGALLLVVSFAYQKDWLRLRPTAASDTQ